MSEREIRGALRMICDELDARATRAARKVVLPVLLGAGVALSVGCDGCRKVDRGPVPPYGVEAPVPGKKPDAGPVPPYSVPVPPTKKVLD